MFIKMLEKIAQSLDAILEDINAQEMELEDDDDDAEEQCIDTIISALTEVIRIRRRKRKRRKEEGEDTDMPVRRNLMRDFEVCSPPCSSSSATLLSSSKVEPPHFPVVLRRPVKPSVPPRTTSIDITKVKRRLTFE